MVYLEITMSDYIAIEGETPRLLEDLREILPGASFPSEEMTDVSNFLDILAVTAYEPCDITNAEPTNLEHDERAELGVATRVGGALQAAWAIVSADSTDAADTLTAAKTNAKQEVDDYSINTIWDTIETFATGVNPNDPEVDLRPNPETVAILSQILLVAQNAETGADVTDANGVVVSLTLTQLQTLVAAVTELAACIAARRAVARADIDAAVDFPSVNLALSTYKAVGYGPFELCLDN